MIKRIRTVPRNHCQIRRVVLLCLSCLFLQGISPIVVSTFAESPLGFNRGERVVLLGGTFAERLQYFGYFETLLSYRESENDLKVRNMAWAGDEVALMPRPYNFIISAGEGIPDDPNPGYGFAFEADKDHRILSAHLKSQKADVILLCFGTNEAFQGKAGLAKFAADYHKLIDRLGKQKFNGKSTPRLVLVSPVAQEKLGEPYSDPAERNDNLKTYTARIAEVAKQNDLLFVDLFTPTFSRMSKNDGEPLTIDGSQLNARGQKYVAEMLAAGLGITDPWSDKLEAMRKLVVEKNKQFFYRWRPINGEYVYGRRRTPFGVINFPPEMKQLDQMVEELEKKIYAEAKKQKASK